MVRHFQSHECMSHAAAQEVVDTLSRALAVRDHAAVVLSGGSTPRRLYELLAAEPYRGSISWKRLFFFWGDERCVPADTQESNYRMALENLLSLVPIVPAQVCRIPVELGWEKAALAYEHTLKALYARRTDELPSGTTIFDLVLLGIGVDGHTASIFPGSPALHERKRWVMAVEAPESVVPSRRVTMTMAALNNAGRVLVLAGAGKKEIAQEIFEKGAAIAEEHPAAAVRGKTTGIFIADRG